MKIINTQHCEKNSSILFDEHFVSQFSFIKQETCLTPERLEKIQIKKLLWSRKKKMLIEILYKYKAALAWNFNNVKKIEKEIILSMKIQIVSHETWQTASFLILKKLNNKIVRMLRKQLKNEILKSCLRFYQNSWFLIKKKKMSIYQLVNAVMKMNAVTVQNAYISSSIEEFTAEFARIKIRFIINFYSEYN